MKIEIIQTPHNTIRTWIKFNEDSFQHVKNSKEYLTFTVLSIWGDFDKREPGIVSWELPLSLSAYLKEKFAHYPNCEINLL